MTPVFSTIFTPFSTSRRWIAPCSSVLRVQSETKAAGVTSGEDVARALAQGADSSGGTSGIVQNPDWRAVLTQMFTAIAEHKKNRAQEEQMRPRTASRVNG